MAQTITQLILCKIKMPGGEHAQEVFQTKLINNRLLELRGQSVVGKSVRHVLICLLHVKDRVTGGEIFHLLVHCPNVCSKWGLLHTETKNSLWVSHVGVRNPTTWANLHCFPRHISRNSQVSNQHPDVG